MRRRHDYYDGNRKEAILEVTTVVRTNKFLNIKNRNGIVLRSGDR